MWRCGGTGRLLAFLVERFSSNQAVGDDLSRQPQEKNSVNQLFFLLSKAPLFTQSAGRGGWYPILGVWDFFIDPPPRGGEGVPHITKNPYTAAWYTHSAPMGRCGLGPCLPSRNPEFVWHGAICRVRLVAISTSEGKRDSQPCTKIASNFESF